ncbi:MAG: hypothetical protein IPK99_04115 [Flavobacteriales bacterium]|nr:hypothetical protein [Flavobacteriales bacterium]
MQGPVLSLVVGLFLSACGGDGGSRNVDPVALDPPFFRLDHALFHAAPDSIASVSLRLYAEQGDFYRLYVEEIFEGRTDRRSAFGYGLVALHPGS